MATAHRLKQIENTYPNVLARWEAERAAENTNPSPAVVEEKSRVDSLAKKCRESFREFVRHAWPVLEPRAKLEWNWHLDALCDHIQFAFEGWMRAQETGETPLLQNLLMNIPPGTAKSRVVSVCANAWMWLHCPSWRVLCISASPRVATRDAVYCRDLIMSQWYQETFRPLWEFSEDQNAKGFFSNTEGGFRQSISVGARITGDRADCILVDDPHDASEVDSDVMREGVLDWWDQAACNRANDLRVSLRIGIMQRLKENDWSGHVLASGEWEHLCIPMEYVPGKRKLKLVQEGEVFKVKWVDEPTAIGWKDPRTIAGELMFPARFPARILAKERRRLGSGGYAGQMQQDPMAADGIKFKRKWFRYFEDAGEFYTLHLPGGGTKRFLKEFCRLFATIDTAMSEKKSADYTVIAIWAITPENDLLLLEIIREQMEDPAVDRLIRGLLRSGRVPYVAIETKGNGTTLFQRFVLDGLAVKELKADTDKITRSTLASVDMENGKIYFAAGAVWLEEYERELLLFPNGAYDDQVDVTSYASIEKGRDLFVEAPSGPIGVYSG